MIKRDAIKKLTQLAKTFKAVSITGPRQSGKTTLVKSLFKDKPYVSLENPDSRNFAINDPRGFIDTYANGAILDEVQRTPELFSYLQEILDNSKQKGLFILTGSNNFLLQQSISQTLAGRIGSITLLPFSMNELSEKKIIPDSDDELMLKGFYPPVYDQKIPVGDFCPNYIRTYIEKDVRQIKNITNLIIFEKFLSLLAGRCAQELNMSSLSSEVGVDVKTIQSWIGILESSYIIYLLKPHYKNFNKTIVKRPKIYFYDTSLVCSLLGIFSVNHLQSHPVRGFLFENMVITEFVKQRTNKGLPVNLFYWRDKTGHEIDLIIDNAGILLPIEIKSGKTINNDFFKNIGYWCKLSNQKKSILLYSGNEYQKRSNGTEVYNWRKLTELNL
ncbi:MAG: AAA family ATPase [Bacteroidetes bacterium CG23_combo_of_CG06-09_8_20_14_all_32_9]|nr:MAG: AAA family ATPase [Bacteroidetes bacterium CG23_combo_of_CG06-09_8_20_14_all_32_9]